MCCGPSSVINVAHSWRETCSDTTEMFQARKVGETCLFLVYSFCQTLGMYLSITAVGEFLGTAVAIVDFSYWFMFISHPYTSPMKNLIGHFTYEPNP